MTSDFFFWKLDVIRDLFEWTWPTEKVDVIDILTTTARLVIYPSQSLVAFFWHPSYSFNVQLHFFSSLAFNNPNFNRCFHSPNFVGWYWSICGYFFVKAKVVSPLGRGVTDNVRKSSSQILICEVSESGRVLESIQPRTALRKIETPELLFFWVQKAWYPARISLKPSNETPQFSWTGSIPIVDCGRWTFFFRRFKEKTPKSSRHSHIITCQFSPVETSPSFRISRWRFRTLWGRNWALPWKRQNQVQPGW